MKKIGRGMHKPGFTVKVGKFDVPVIGAERPTLVRFYKARPDKNGVFAFWTAIYKEPVDGKKSVWGRAKIGMDAGDRFARMEYERKAKYISKDDQKVYERTWTVRLKAGANLKMLRPSTEKEVLLWLDSHSEPVFGKWKLIPC
jgi:hypothetical protein